MNESVRNFFALLTGLLVLAYVIWVLGWENIVVSLEQVRLDLFMLAAFFYLVNELFASSALRAATGGGVVDVCLAHMRGMLYSNVTPGRVGYYYTAFSIAKKTDKSASENVGFVTLLQGVNFSLKVFLCVAAVLYFSCILSLTDYGGLFILVVSAPFFVVVAVLLVLYSNVVNVLVEGVPFLRNYLHNVVLMQEASRQVDKITLGWMVFYAIVSWVAMSVQWFFIAHSLGADIGFVSVLLLQPLLTTVMFIPFSPAGLGFTEGGGAILFSLLGLGEASGVTFILLVRFNSILVDSFGFIGRFILDK